MQRVKWHLLAAIHYDAAGDPGEAERHWRKALTDAGALNNPYELLQVQWQYAERELARGTEDSGLDTLIAAIEGNEIKLPESERLIARFRAAAGDSQGAALAAQRWKQFAGEAWTPEDQTEFERLSQ